jgi:hypothetical protein
LSKEIIQYSRTFAWQVQMPWNQAHAPLLVKSFPNKPRTRLEASSVVYAIGPSVTTFSIDFSSKTWFFLIYLNFQGQKSL